MSIQYLDGRRFAVAVTAGADWVRQTRQHLNRINVFPVADGDTGTNMALSLAATAAVLRHEQEVHLSAVVGRAAEASVLGAKGNSGLILAHWFLGLAEAVGGKDRIDSDDLAHAFQKASETVYHAIEEPIEGTILTIMRVVSERAREVARGGLDIADLFREILRAAELALSKTPEMLEVLREAQVVDAGAQGFVNFLHGVERALLGRPAPEIPIDDEDDAPHPLAHGADPKFRFCTELIVRGENEFDDERLRSQFGSFGDSMLVATTGSRFKLHLHTNEPEKVIAIAAKLGVIEERKVDDMKRQSIERDQAPTPPLIPLDQQPFTPAVLCDSCGDIPEPIARELGIERVPLQLLIDGEVIFDQFDLPTEEIYEQIFRRHRSAGTSQPSPGAFVEALRKVHESREVIICSLSSGMSGTYKSALSATRLAEQPRVEVFDSLTGSLGLGMMAIGAARLAAKGVEMDDLLHWLRTWRGDSKLVFTVSTLEYLRKGGRVGRVKGMLGDLMGLRPIFGLAEDGKLVVLDRPRGQGRTVERMLELVSEAHADGTRVRVGLVESTESGQLDQAEEVLRKRLDVVEVLRTPITAVIGAHMGPGAWGIFTQVVRDDDPLL